MKQIAVKKAGTMLCMVSALALSSVSLAQEVTHATLSPPWYLLKSKLSAALDADPCVHVDDLTGEGLGMEINVSVCNEEKAQALAAFINRTYEYGDKLAVTVSVYSPAHSFVDAIKPDTLDETVELVNRALKGNRYFVNAGIGTKHYSEAVYAVFKPKVIQFFSDDISDWYSNSNEVAAKVFSELFNFNPYREGAIKLYATTKPIKKHQNPI